MVDWCVHAQLPVYIILNKADKLSRGKANATLNEVRRKLADIPIIAGIQLFSSLKRSGVEQAVKQLCRWLEMPCRD